MQDIRYTIRQLARRPGFTAVAILTLAIGIGANTAIFSAARAALFEPLPFAHEDRLVRIYMTPEAGGPLISLRPAVFLAIEERARAFDRLVAQRFTGYALATDEGPERVVGIAVSEGWGETLGVSPVLGRLFSPEEEALGEDSGVLLLSHGAWQRRFAGERSVLGRVLELDGRPHTVIGVMPRGFKYPYEAELWVPMQVRGPQRGVWAFNVPARLAPGWTVEQAREDLRAVAAAASSEVSELQPGTTLTAVPLREVFIRDEGRTLVVLLAAVGFFMLIVCANLANLLLARALGRGREFALRAAVGASRARLFRQLLIESVVLAALGGAAGIAVANFAGALVEPLLPSRLSFVGAAPRLDTSVLAFAVLVSLGSGLLFGLVPALRLSHKRPYAALQSNARSIGSVGGRRLERALVIGELALALTLLSGIGLMLRDFQRLHSAELGYETEGLTTFAVSLSQEAYPTPESRSAFATAAERELGRLPGVVAAGATTMFPSSRGASLSEVIVEGRDPLPGERNLVHDRIVTPGLIEAMGIPLLQGRRITEADRADQMPVVVISAALARRLWPDQDAIGKRVRNRREGDAAPWMTVVGVVGDVKEFYDVTEAWYRPYPQHADSRSAGRVVFAIRSGGTVVPSLATLRRAIGAVDPALPLFDVISAADLYAASFSRQRHAALLGSVFAAFALALAAIGIYGSISYGVNRRTQEIGVRMALGSDRWAILRSIAGEGGRLVAIGMAIGLAGALILSRFMASALTEIGAFDFTTFVGSALVLTTAGLAATLIPALRATRIDPVEALRPE